MTGGTGMQFEQVRVTTWRRKLDRYPYPIHSVRTLFIREDCRGSFVRDIPTTGEALSPFVTWVAVEGSDVQAVYSGDLDQACDAHVRLVRLLNAKLGGSVVVDESGGLVIQFPESMIVTDDILIKGKEAK